MEKYYHYKCSLFYKNINTILVTLLVLNVETLFCVFNISLTNTNIIFPYIYSSKLTQ